MTGVARWMGIVACLWMATGVAEASSAPLVLRIFNDFHTASELGLSPQAFECWELEPLIKGVVGPLFADYVQKNGLNVSEDDLKDYCRRQLPDESSFSKAWAEWTPTGNSRRARQAAIVELTMWKLQKSLFEQYGGRVTQSDWAPPQAFDAMYDYVLEREKAGDFTIHDERLKIRFWICLRMPKDPLVSEEVGRERIEEHPLDRKKRLLQPDP